MRIPAQTLGRSSQSSRIPFNIEEVMHEQANTRKSDQEIYGGLMRASLDRRQAQWRRLTR
jgi:hypothetical protein